MDQEPLQEPRAEARAARVLLAGGHGALGGEVLHRLAALGVFGPVEVLAREPLAPGVRGVSARLVPGDDPAGWPALAADIAILLFEPPGQDGPRGFWVPQPGQLVPLARWLHRSGVGTLAVVSPHPPGQLPEALKHGLAGADEHAVVTLGFERLLFLRIAQRPAVPVHPHPLARLADWMLSFSRYMIPDSEQPVRASRVAEMLAQALRHAPPGVHVASPQLVWQAARGEVEPVVRAWLRRP